MKNSTHSLKTDHQMAKTLEQEVLARMQKREAAKREWSQKKRLNRSLPNLQIMFCLIVLFVGISI